MSIVPPNKQIENRYSYLNLPVTPVDVRELFPWHLTPNRQSSSNDAPINPQYLRLAGAEATKRVFESAPDKAVELSPKGTSYLRDAMAVLEEVKVELIKKGEITETPVISGKPFPEFLQMVATEVSNQEEFRYIMNAIDRMIQSIERVRSDIWMHQSEGVPVPDTIGEPKHRISKTPRITY